MINDLTKLDVCNQVLDALSQSRTITELQQTDLSSAEARFFDRNFVTTVRAQLRANVWSFSKVQAVLTVDATAPDFDYAYRYAVPDNWLRVLPITEDGSVGGRLLDFKKIGNFIHIDHGGDLRVEGVQEMLDPAEWDASFVEVVVAKLAMKYAARLTGKTNYYQMAKDMYQEALDTAIAIDAIEDYPDPIEQHDILRVREL